MVKRNMGSAESKLGKYRVTYTNSKTGRRVILRFKNKREADVYKKKVLGKEGYRYITKHLGYAKPTLKSKPKRKGLLDLW
jgi:hypothetical protein